MSGDSEKACFLVSRRGRRAGLEGAMGKIAEVFGAKLRDFTTIAIGGAADRMVFPASARDVQEIVRAERAAGRQVRTLGAGSNILVSDGGVRGSVLCLKKNMGKILFAGGGSVVSDAGTMLPRFAVLCALSGLSGVEELAGIPGTVGGALVMNAGAYGRSIGELVEWIEVVDAQGELRRLAAREILFGYRETRLPAEGTIVRAGFRLAAGSPDAAFALMKAINEKRRATQPWGERTFGSTFRNPDGAEKAAALLDRCGMKGAREGDALFSDKHANFVVNVGRAKAMDVLKLMRRGQEAVWQTFGVALVPEVRMWGDFDE